VERYPIHPDAAIYYLTYSVVEWLPARLAQTLRICDSSFRVPLPPGPQAQGLYQHTRNSPLGQEALVRGYQAASTVSRSPIAFVTASKVERRGLPRADNARYRLSRSIPAALATLAMPCA
jgi:hypothetical protein